MPSVAAAAAKSPTKSHKPAAYTTHVRRPSRLFACGAVVCSVDRGETRYDEKVVVVGLVVVVGRVVVVVVATVRFYWPGPIVPPGVVLG